MTKAFVRAHLALLLALIALTATCSYAYFHLDEYFQVLEWTWVKLGIDQPWALPWEYGARMRSWTQPAIYFAIARAIGLRDIFQLAFVFRLATGLATWGAIAAFLRTSLPWAGSVAEKRLHVRVVTLAGFLPYLAVRTSSETLSAAAFTAAFAIALSGASRGPRGWTAELSLVRAAIAGALSGLAFEARFQTAFLVLGLLAWLAFVARASIGRLVVLCLSGLAVVALAAPIDRWGYGEWTFPPWTYLRANVLEGAASAFGSELPFAYAWMLPANVFLPIVAAVLVLAIVAWARNPRHPITWTTLPFFLVHNLLPHKEERFLFPLAILATGFVVMALGPSAERESRLARFARWGFTQRAKALGVVLAVWSTLAMALLAVYPLGWHHHVRFTRHVHDALGGELRAHALPELDLGTPAFHGPVYDLEKAPADEIARRVDEGTAREWLVFDVPGALPPALAARATLVWSEVPCDDARVLAAAAWYDARARPPLRPIRFRNLYRLARRGQGAGAANVPPPPSQTDRADAGVNAFGGPP